MALFQAASVLPEANPRSYTHSCLQWFDQGQEGACVPHAWGHEAEARPVIRHVNHATIWEWYDWCRRNDQWQGEDYDGTSVDAGAKAMRQWGLMDEWYWGSGIGDVLMAIGRRGPVVFGIDWLDGMFRPDSDGFIHATGSVAGGHSILGRGCRIVWKSGTTMADRLSPGWLDHVDLDRSWVLLRNSWGQAWGMNGDCRISARGLSGVLDNGGEVCIPTHRIPA